MGGGASSVPEASSTNTDETYATDSEEEKDEKPQKTGWFGKKTAKPKTKKKKKRKKLTAAQLEAKGRVFAMKLEAVGEDKWRRKCMYEELKKIHPVTTILPNHMGLTWAKQGNHDLTDDVKFVPKLLHTHKTMEDPDEPSDEEKDDNKQVAIVLSGDNATDGVQLFEELKSLNPESDKHWYWDKISKQWDIQGLQDDIHMFKNRGKFKVFSDPVVETPPDMIEVKERTSELILPKYENWDEVDIQYTNPDVTVHYSGPNGMENFNDMYRDNAHMMMQQRLAHFNRDLYRSNRMHRAKGLYTLMKMRITDATHYQEQRKTYKLNKKTGLGLYRPDTEKYLSLHWSTQPDMKAVYYTDTLMRAHHENIDDDPVTDQFVTVKAIDDLGFSVEYDQVLHEHNGNRKNETKKLTAKRKQEIERAARVKAENVRKTAAKAARSMFG